MSNLENNTAELQELLQAANALPTDISGQAVLFTEQTLTDEQKAQARKNIGITGTGADGSDANVTAENIKSALGYTPANADDVSQSAAIIDVIELPTENINEEVFYRLMTGYLSINQVTQPMYTVRCVETLPETGEPATNLDQTAGNVYYSLSDNEAYGYVDATLSVGLGVPVGWYPGATLLGALGFEYKGVITDILDDPMDGAVRLVLEFVTYDYKDGLWTSHKVIGRTGTGASSECFNHTSNVASGIASHAEGNNTTASGNQSHAEGHRTTASGDSSHAEGYSTTASGNQSHAEGNNTTASGNQSHAEGHRTTASGHSSHAEGYETTASGHSSHAEGYETTASGHSSHAEGFSTTAEGRSQHTQGEYNIIDPDADPNLPNARGKYAHIVGNGTSDTDRSNVHTLDWDGNAWYQGDVYVGSTSGKDRDEGSVKLAKVTDIPTDTIRYSAQTLTDEQKAQARANIGVVEEPFIIAVSGNETEGYTADKTGPEIRAAFDAGRQLLCNYDINFKSIPLQGIRARFYEVLKLYDAFTFCAQTAKSLRAVDIVLSRSDSSIVEITVTNHEFVSNLSTLTINGIPYDGTKAVAIKTPGLSVIPITVDADGQATSPLGYNEIGQLIAQGYTVFCDVNGYLLPLLYFDQDGFGFYTTIAGEGAFITIGAVILSDDSVSAITFETTSLPNPNALVINGISYDGSSEADLTNTINSMIDDKIAAITNAEGVAF